MRTSSAAFRFFWPEAVIVAFIKMKGYPWRPVAVQ
jgi:hypothetical protein